MFISSSFLQKFYGVDEDIAQFFVDREPPKNNFYWHGKLLYLRPSPGYLFIPLIVDLLYKIGIGKKELISEPFVSLMENIGHVSALAENEDITAAKAIAMCNDLARERGGNIEWLDELLLFLNGGNSRMFSAVSAPFKALHRGDVFLFSISILKFSSKLSTNIAEIWFAAIGLLLLLDDAEDVESDGQTGEENAFIESGLNAEGREKIFAFVNECIKRISPLNPKMALQLEKQFNDIVEQNRVYGY